MPTHFIELMDQLQSRCLSMASMVQEAVSLASTAVINRDASLAQQVLDGEGAIDSEEVEIERQAIHLLVLHHPAATDFRTVFGIVKINSDLERIADCAVNIAQQVPRFADTHVELPAAIKQIANATLRQVDDTVRCVATRNAELADQICRGDDVVDALNSQIIQELQVGMARDGTAVPADLALIMVSKNFERIGDHCNNIAEDIVFLAKGHIIRHTHPGN